MITFLKILIGKYMDYSDGEVHLITFVILYKISIIIKKKKYEILFYIFR